MERHRILISGAGIAGPALAWWLHRYGWDCTVIERSPELRTGGQNVDIRGAARSVIDRMGLDGQIRDHGTGERGTRFVDGRDRTVAAFPVERSATAGATAEREILRGRLASLLYERTDADVDYRFGRRIEAVRDEPNAARVSFDDGATERFDVVAVAEGVNSATRDAVFGDVARRRLGLTIGYFSIDREATDTNWWRWYNAVGGRTISLRPDDVGRIRVTLSFLAGPGAGLVTLGEQQRLLVTRFRDAGGPAERVLDGLATADDLYLDDLTQIRSPDWSSGRTVLLGDAGYCATPVSGMGTSLALVGAYLLAGNLAAHVHHRDAFAGYDRVLRPYVERAQHLPPGTPRLAHPRSAVGVGILRTVLRVVASPVLTPVRRHMFAPPADRIRLPDFRHLEKVAPA